MPQLDVTTYASQLFWLLITFVPLYLVIVRVALPRVGEVLEARHEKIEDDLKKAAARQEEAEAVMAEYEKLQAESHASAQVLLRDAQDAMSAEAAAENAKLGETLAAQGAEAEAGIAAAKAEALASLGDAVAEVTTAATEKLIGLQPGADEVAAAIAAAREAS